MRLRWFGLFDCSDHRTCSIVVHQSARGVGLQDLSLCSGWCSGSDCLWVCGSRAAVILEGPKGRRGTSARAAAVAVAARAGAHAASGQGTNPPATKSRDDHKSRRGVRSEREQLSCETFQLGFKFRLFFPITYSVREFYILRLTVRKIVLVRIGCLLLFFEKKIWW